MSVQTRLESDQEEEEEEEEDRRFTCENGGLGFWRLKLQRERERD